MKPTVPAIPIILVLLMTGCQSKDERLVKMAEEHEKRQAEQNRQMAQLQQEVAAGSRRLVEADAEAREKLMALQEGLRMDQADVGRQRDQLEAERRDIAAQRNRDPIIASTLMQIGLILACLVPLVLCGYLIHSLRSAGDSDATVVELLVEELVSERPKLLSGSVVADRRGALGPPTAAAEEPT